jgi:RNA polymerase sigma-B factor
MHTETENYPEISPSTDEAGGAEDSRISRLRVALGVLSNNSQFTGKGFQEDDRLQRAIDAFDIFSEHLDGIEKVLYGNAHENNPDNDSTSIVLSDEQHKLVIENLRLARIIAKRYITSGEPLDDIEQVARIGLMKAAGRFDPSKGRFIDYAFSSMRGEIKRYFRDKTWSINVPRYVKEIGTRIFPTELRLQSTLGRDPTQHEVADALGLTIDEYRDIKLGWQNYKASSLDSAIGTSKNSMKVGGAIADQSDDYATTENERFVTELLAHLEPQEVTILKARAGMPPFDHDYTQQEVAELLGISQVHVGRLEKQALEKLYDLGIKSFN